MAEAKIKGMSLVNVAEYIRQKHGDKGFEQLAGRLAPAEANILRGAFANEWYPLASHVQILKAYAELFHGGDYAQTAQLGVYNLQQSIKGVYRIIVRMLEPDTLIARSMRLWRTFLSEGEVATERLGPKELRLNVRGLDPVHRAFCMSLVGSFVGSIEACGAKDAVCEHTACRLEGKPDCEYHVRWS